MVGVVDFWARLFPPAEPIGFVKEGGAERRTGAVRGPPQVSYGWQDSSKEVQKQSIWTLQTSGLSNPGPKD